MKMKNNNLINTPEYQEALQRFRLLEDHIQAYKDGAYVHTGPFISAITRTQGKRKEELEELLLAFCSQTDRDFEIVIVCHKVNAEQYNMVNDVVKSFPNWLQKQIRILRCDEGNRTTPLNFGFAHANGLYASIVDDDDVIMENWVEAFHKLLPDNYGKILHAMNVQQDWMRIKDDNGNWILRASGKPDNVYCKFFDIYDQLQLNYCPPISLTFPVYAFKEIGIHFDETLTTTEDWDFLMRTAFFTGVKDVKEVTSIYRMWVNAENSHTVHSQSEWDKNFETIIKKFEQLPILYNFNLDKQVKTPVCVCFFFSKKNKFKRSNGITITNIELKENRVCLELDDLLKLGKIKTFRIDPDDVGKVSVDDFQIKLFDDKNNEIDLTNVKQTSNGTLLNDSSIGFKNDDPQMIFALAQPTLLSKITVSYKLSSLSYNAKPQKRHGPLYRFAKKCKHKAKKIIKWMLRI